MTPDEARASFSAAFERELDGAEQRAFDAALQANPELAREYQAFVALLELARGRAVTEHADADAPGAAGSSRAPDLLPGVQRRLRARSKGRFYADRFAQRLGPGLLQPLPLALIMLALLALAWLALSLQASVAVTPAP